MKNGAPVAGWRQEFIAGCIICLPTVLGYLSIGFSAGALARVAGMSVAEVALMSLILYAGSGQFIVVGMLQAGAAATAIVVSIFFVNLRHLLLSTYMAPLFKKMSAFKNIVLGAQLTDETFGVASVARREITFAWMFGLNLTAYLNWLVGNIAGAYAVRLLPADFLHNLHFALVAMFVGLVVLQIAATQRRAMQIFAGMTAVALLYPISWLAGDEFGVILAAVVAALIAMGVARWKSA